MDNSAIKGQILDDFKTYNSIKDEENDKLYNLYIDKAMQSILNLTNRVVFPVELRYIVLELINDFLDMNKSKNNEIPVSDTKDISSISEHGRSVSFDNQSSTYYSTLISSHINEQLKLRKIEIYRYRLLYKEVVPDGQD